MTAEESTSLLQPGTAEYAKRTALIDAAEARLQQAASFTWAVPTLALAGQAFLLTIALDDGSSDSARLVATGAGVITLFASLQFMAKHTFNFDWWEAVIERERKALGWDSLQRNKMLDGRLQEFRPDTLLRKREWYEPEPGLYEQNVAADGKPLKFGRRVWARARRPLLWMRRLFAVQMRATAVWSGALMLLLVIDALLFVDALADRLG